MEWLRSKWNFENYFTVNLVGRGGGLALIWMNEVNVDILSYSNSHIDVKIGHSNRNIWRFIGFYGHPNTNLRDQS